MHIYNFNMMISRKIMNPVSSSLVPWVTKPPNQ